MDKDEFVLHIYEEQFFADEMAKKLEGQLNVVSEYDFDDALDMLKPGIVSIIISFKNVNQSLTSFLRKLKSTAYANIPVLAVLSTKEHIYTKNILKMGFSDYISQESDIEDIVEQIIGFVSRQKIEHALIDGLSFAIIDDDLLHTQLVKRVLQQNGVRTVDSFQSGEQFLKDTHGYDVFLVDIVMKQISGIMIVKHIRENYPHSLIVVVSSISEDKIIINSFKQGADDFMPKPLNVSIFIAKIFARLIRERKSNNQ